MLDVDEEKGYLKKNDNSHIFDVIDNKMIPANVSVYLVGDSVLDNFIWLSDPKQNLTQQLKIMSVNPENIHNFAVDETETNDILIGKVPRNPYQVGRQSYGLEKYPIDDDGYVYPIKLLKKTIDISNIKNNVVVLSVGGNDARVCLPYLVSGYKKVLDKMEEKGFTKNYTELVRSLSHLTHQVVLVLVYRPYKDFYPEAHSEVSKLLDVVRKMFLTIAKEFKLPIIDLSKTFDPNDSSHYGKGNGSSPIEPSNKSSQFIADLISTVIFDFKFGSDSSKVYYGHGVITIENN